MNDREFDHFLRSAQTGPALPNSFHHDVWARIEATEVGHSLGVNGSWLDSLLTALARPMPAAALLALTIVGGLWLGSGTPAQASDLKTAYIQSVSPFLHAHAGQAR